MGRALQTVTAENLPALRRELAKEWSYHAGRRHRVKIQIPEEAMLYSIHHREDGGTGLHWREIYGTDIGFGEPGKFFTVDSVQYLEDGTVHIWVRMGNRRQRWTHFTLGIHLDPETEIRWRKA